MKKFLLFMGLSLGLMMILQTSVFAVYEGSCTEDWLEGDWVCEENCDSRCSGSSTYNSCLTWCDGNNFCSGCIPCSDNMERHPDSGVCIYDSDASCRGAFGEGATYDGNEIDGCTCAPPATWDGSYCHSADQICGEGQTAHPDTGTCIWSSNTWCEIAFGDGAYYDGNSVDGCGCHEDAIWDGSSCYFLEDGFAEESCFLDTLGAQHETAICYVYQNGIVQGYSDGTYGPNNSINRAEFMKIMMGSNFDDSVLVGSYCFDDVGADWFAKYVCAAYDMGIVNGYSDGTFKPASNINLAEALKIIFEAAGVDLEDAGGAWYQKYLDAANSMGLLFNVNSDPAHLLTRGEMAQIIYSADNL